MLVEECQPLKVIVKCEFKTELELIPLSQFRYSGGAQFSSVACWSLILSLGSGSKWVHSVVGTLHEEYPDRLRPMSLGAARQ